MGDFTVYEPKPWLHHGSILRSKSSEPGEFFVREVKLGSCVDDTQVRVLRLSLGDTLKLSAQEVYDRFEPTGRESSLPHRT